MSKQYKVIVAGALGPGLEKAAADLSERVEAAMRDGWTPFGAVTVAPPDGIGDRPFMQLLQPVIKG